MTGVGPEGCHGEQDVADEDGHDTHHDLDVHGDCNLEGSRDQTVLSGVSEVSCDTDPIQGATQADEELGLAQVEEAWEDVGDGALNCAHVSNETEEGPLVEEGSLVPEVKSVPGELFLVSLPLELCKGFLFKITIVINIFIRE